MDFKKIAIVPKMTKFEYDQYRLNLTGDDVIGLYKKRGSNYEKILESHNQQKDALGKIKGLFTGADFLERNALTKDAVKKYDLVISFGGDNHFSYVAHFLDSIPILGINSDPTRSEGAFTSASPRDLENVVSNLAKDKYVLERWPRLAVSVNDKMLDELAVSEIFIGEEKRAEMSRHILTLNGYSEEQKGSGLIISTGAGSTGWYNSSSHYLFPNGDIFPKTNKEARFVLTEPFNGKLLKYKMLHGSIREKDDFRLTSLSDLQAILTIDSLKTVPLTEGSRIAVSFGEPLNVLMFEDAKVLKAA